MLAKFSLLGIIAATLLLGLGGYFFFHNQVGTPNQITFEKSFVATSTKVVPQKILAKIPTETVAKKPAPSKTINQSASSAPKNQAFLVAPTQNPNSRPASTTPSLNQADHLVISEVQIAGIDAGDEFIELYNPTNSEVDLSSWSIQYLSGSASSTNNVSKKNFDSTNKIPARGFFLIARGKNSSGGDGYAGQTSPDLIHRTFSLSGSSTGAKIFLVNDQEKIADFNDANIIDQLDYSFLVPPASQSLERKALQGADCVSPQNSGELLGNACDTNNYINDFELRTTPNPQNTHSPTE